MTEHDKDGGDASKTLQLSVLDHLFVGLNGLTSAQELSRSCFLAVASSLKGFCSFSSGASVKSAINAMVGDLQGDMFRA